MKLSVVVAAWAGDGELRRAIEALGASVPAGTEILVSGEGGITSFLLPSSPAVGKREGVTPAATVPERRAAGLAAATGDVIALTEDHCVVGSSWAEAILHAHAEGHGVVAGAIDIAPGASLLDLAVYLFDYAAFAEAGRSRGARRGGKAAPPESAPCLSGANVSFTRAALEALRAAWADGFVEQTVEAAIRSASMPVFLAEDARVVHDHHYRAVSITRKFFLGGRWFGGTRRKEIGAAELMARIAAQPAVPALLTARVVRKISHRPGLLLRCSLALPWLIWLASVWSAGEWAGYVSGPGNSALHWK